MKYIAKLNLKIIIPFIILVFISLITLKYINPLLSSNVSHINFLQKQLFGIMLGIIGMVMIYQVDLLKAKFIIDIIYWILFGMLLILALNPPLIGNLFVNSSNGADGWFMFFTPQLSFQPVEFFKIFIVLKLAMLSKDYIEHDFKESHLLRSYFIHGAIPMGLVLLEPDLGGTLLLAFVGFFMLLLTLRDKKLTRIMLLVLVITLGIVAALIFSDLFREIIVKITPLQSYQLSRLDAWLDPFSTDLGFQLSQSLVLMGSAGPFGHGAGFNTISIPEAHTDLIFVTATGFWGWTCGLVIIASYLTIIIEIFNIAIKQEDLQHKFTLIGFGCLFFIQVFENIGMMTGLLPITGIVLPFLSYGISALLTYCAILAIILNISKNTIFENKPYIER